MKKKKIFKVGDLVTINYLWHGFHRKKKKIHPIGIIIQIEHDDENKRINLTGDMFLSVYWFSMGELTFGAYGIRPNTVLKINEQRILHLFF